MARRRKHSLKAGDVYISNGRPLVREEEGRFDPKNWKAALSVSPTLSRFFTREYGSKREIKAAAARARSRRKHDVIVVSNVKGAFPGANWALCRRRGR